MIFARTSSAAAAVATGLTEQRGRGTGLLMAKKTMFERLLMMAMQVVTTEQVSENIQVLV